MKWVGIILMVVGGGSIVSTLLGVSIEPLVWINQWGLLAGWAIRIGLFLFGSMIYGFGSSSG